MTHTDITISDTEIIEWLEMQGRDYLWKVQTERDYPYVKNTVFVMRNSSSGEKTLREAVIKKIKESLK